MSKPQQGQAQEFRCFHCNEVFSGEAAKKHFGSPYNTPFHLDKVLALTRESALFEAEQLNLSDTCPDTDCDHSSCIVGRNLARQVRALAASRSEEATPQEKVQQTVQPARGRDENTASIPLALETSTPTTAVKSVEYSADSFARNLSINLADKLFEGQWLNEKVERPFLVQMLYDELAESGAPAAGSTERWIPVSERWPDANPNNKHNSVRVLYIENGQIESGRIWFGEAQDSDITHWRPQPEMPALAGTDTDVAKEKND